MRPDELNVYLWRDGFHLFFPMRGKDRWRVIGILPEELRARDDVTFDEVVPSIAREAGADLAFRQCDWFSTYRIHHRAAERFRDRRCFLLGDAAHIHSPAGAQGMNTGLQDAYNLAWKLALVVQGRADAALLDTYEQERIPVAQRLLETTDRAFQAGRLGRLAAAAVPHDDHRPRRRDRDEARSRSGASRSAPSRRSASAIRRARSRRRCPACRRARRARAIASRGCGSGSAERPSRTCSSGSTTRASTCWCSATRRRGRFRRHGPRARHCATMPGMSASSRAPTSAGRHSICCVRTAMSGCADRVSTPRRSGTGSPNAPSTARALERT